MDTWFNNLPEDIQNQLSKIIESIYNNEQKLHSYLSSPQESYSKIKSNRYWLSKLEYKI